MRATKPFFFTSLKQYSTLHFFLPPCAEHKFWRTTPLLHPGMQHLLPPPWRMHKPILRWMFVHPLTRHTRPPPWATQSPWFCAPRLHPVCWHRRPPPWLMHMPRVTELRAQFCTLQRLLFRFLSPLFVFCTSASLSLAVPSCIMWS